MAPITNPQVREAIRNLARQWGKDGVATNITRPQLYTAGRALADWLDGELANINQALPGPARRELSQRQKSELLAAIALGVFKRDRDDG